MAAQIITKDYLNYLFEYKNGKIFWKNKTSKHSNIIIGNEAGHLRTDGYKQIAINNKIYQTHRIIFMMFNGFMPNKIDHKDNNPSNNLIDNLREASHSQNMQNAKKRKDNNSGYKNINYHKATNSWIVRIAVNGIRKHFGCYKDIDYAKFVANAMRYKYHGKFAKE